MSPSLDAFTLILALVVVTSGCFGSGDALGATDEAADGSGASMDGDGEQTSTQADYEADDGEPSPNSTILRNQTTAFNITLSAGLSVPGYQVTSNSGSRDGRQFAVPGTFREIHVHGKWEPTYPTNEEVRIRACNDGCPITTEGSSPLTATYTPDELGGKFNGSTSYVLWVDAPQPAGVVVEQPVEITVTVTYEVEAGG